jgi:hypothetical protein
MEEVKREAQQRKIDLAILPTPEAIKTLQENFAETNAIVAMPFISGICTRDPENCS